MDNEILLIEVPGGPAAASAEPAVVVVDEDADATKLPAHAVVLPDGSVRLPLRYPVTLRYRNARSEEVKEDLVEELVMHRLTGADLRAVSAATVASRVVVVIARCCRMHEAKFGPIFDRMDGADASAAGQVADHFLSSGRPTGQ